MKRTILILAALALSPSCKKEAANNKSTAPKTFPRTDTTALWKLVPTNAIAAAVFSEGSLAHLHDGGMRFIKDFAGAPGAAKVLAEMNREAEGLAKALTPEGPKLAGMDLAKGALIYAIGPDEVAMVMPVTDRETFTKLSGGTKKGNRDVIESDMICDEIGGRYVCASSETILDSFGKSEGMKPPEGDMRGHIEAVVRGELLSQLPPPMGAFQELRATATLEPGGITMRVHASGGQATMMKVSGAPRLLAGVAKLNPTGVFSIRARDLWPMFRVQIPAEIRQQPGPAGVMAGDLIDGFDGEVGGYALGGEPGGVLRIGLSNEKPYAKLIDACEQLLPPMIGTGKKDGDRCTITVTPPGSPAITATVWIEDKSLRFGLGNFEGKRDVPPIQPMAVEMLEKPWMFAAWGYGGFLSPEWKELAKIPEVVKELENEEAKMATWFFIHLAELGVAVSADSSGATVLLRLRTSWSNPTVVLDELEPVLASIAGGNFNDLDKVSAIAARHKQAPLARDLKAGVGAAAPMAAFGTLAAIAIPAFMKYIKKSKTSEARQLVKKLYDGGRVYYMDPPATGLTPAEASFPTPSAGPTPPLGSCCQGPDEKCAPDASLWAKEPWVSLQFSVDDPHYYSYQYQVAPDGKSFSVRAFGDLDCDGQYSTFEMKGVAGPDGPMGGVDLYRENELE